MDAGFAAGFDAGGGGGGVDFVASLVLRTYGAAAYLDVEENGL